MRAACVIQLWIEKENGKEKEMELSLSISL